MKTNKAGILIWLTGLAGAGKTTLSNHLFEELKKNHPNCVQLDGDKIREALGDGFKYSLEDRKYLANTYSNFCQMLTNQGMIVIMSTVSLFHSVQAKNRALNKNYIEVWIKVKETTLLKRNQKKIYSDDKHNAVGYGIKPEFPLNPELSIYNDNQEDLASALKSILEVVKDKI